MEEKDSMFTTKAERGMFMGLIAMIIFALVLVVVAAIAIDNSETLNKRISQYEQANAPITSGTVYAIDDIEDSTLHIVRFKQEVFHEERNSYETFFGFDVVTEEQADDTWVGTTYSGD